MENELLINEKELNSEKELATQKEQNNFLQSTLRTSNKFCSRCRFKSSTTKFR